LPLYTGLEVIGGPYLYTHNKTNFTQFGDGGLLGGRFVGDDDLSAEAKWNPDRFRRFARWYDLNWVVCWSPEAERFCLAHPELIEIVDRIGLSALPTPGREFLLGRILRKPNAAVVGQAQVRARPGRIEVKDAQPEGEELVLRYHWTPHLQSDPLLEIEPYEIDEDPVGLIRIKNPPAEFTLYLVPWPAAL
jgi:hypothetical protein